jgi:hypothetical protein
MVQASQHKFEDSRPERANVNAQQMFGSQPPDPDPYMERVRLQDPELYAAL